MKLAVLALLVPVISTFFYWRRRQMLSAEEHRMDWYRSQLLSGALIALLYLIISLALLWSPIWNSAAPDALALFILVAIGLDLFEEVRARLRAPGGADLIPYESHQDMADARDALEDYDEGRGAFLQGMYFRLRSVPTPLRRQICRALLLIL